MTDPRQEALHLVHMEYIRRSQDYANDRWAYPIRVLIEWNALARSLTREGLTAEQAIAIADMREVIR